jgi:hypothetical protein
MKILGPSLFTLSLLLAPPTVRVLHAQVDLAGTWEAELPVNERNETRRLTLEFRAQEDDLSGSIIVGNDPPLTMVDLRVQGDAVMFALTSESDERFRILFIGWVRDDQIVFHATHLFVPEQPPDYPQTRRSPVRREMAFRAVRVR